MVQASRLCDFEQWSEADKKDAETVLFNIFSIFSHRRRAGQVDDISSSRPWRFDTSISSAPSFLSSNRNAFINTHLLMRAAVIDKPRACWVVNTTTTTSPPVWHYA